MPDNLDNMDVFSSGTDDEVEAEDAVEATEAVEAAGAVEAADAVGAQAAGDDAADEVAEEATEENVEQPVWSDDITAIAVLEALLFATDEPVAAQKLAGIIGAGGVGEIKKNIDQLNSKYEQMGCAFRIEAVAGGFQMLTQGRFNPWLSKLIKVRGETKLSPAALETLAIIAYKQPIMRVDVESIRGVAAGEMVRQLIDKGLVKIVGRAEELGRPLLYGTTRKFLEVFGLNNLKDLPDPQKEQSNE